MVKYILFVQSPVSLLAVPRKLNLKMLKQLKANRSSTGLSHFLLLACSLLVAGSATGLTAQTIAPKKASPSQNAVIAEVLRTSYGSTVEAVTSFKPFYLSGDFNGDDAQDI